MGLVDTISRAVGPRCLVMGGDAGQAAIRRDESGIVGPLPVCTAMPGDAEDVCRAVRVCAEAVVVECPQVVWILGRGDCWDGQKQIQVVENGPDGFWNDYDRAMPRQFVCPVP